LQKLEGFTGMNSTQVLEVAKKVFVSPDQKARWEADRKMKWKVDLLATTLAGQLDDAQWANTGRGRARGNP
jgi:hypothetical protein